MPSWDMGYHSEILYTYGYYKEINPLWAKFLFANAGIAFPNIRVGGGYGDDVTGAACACELGFGQGVSINMHAVASGMQWYGTDFNPAQVNFAKHLAAHGHAHIHLYDDAFGDFAQRTDLPQFDYICLHGIWSWISRENQQYIVDFIQNHLKIGGVVYISYNVSPGFIMFEPVRHLMKQFNDSLIAESLNNDARISVIKNFLESVVKVNPSVLLNNPGLPKRIEDTLTKDTHYLTGEYLNEFWDIIHFSDMAKNLERAKLNFACSATGTEHLDNINLTAEQQQLLAQYKGTPLYETTRDFIVNQQFRRDFFVKGSMKLSEEQQQEQLYATGVVLTVPAEDVAYTVNTRIGVANLKKEIYEPIVKLMSDHKVYTFGEVIKALTGKSAGKGAKLTEAQIFEALRTMTLLGTLQPAVKEDTISPEIIMNCQEFNRGVLLDAAGTQINYLACPVIQGGMYVNPIVMQMLAMTLREPKVSASQLSDRILEQIQKHNSVLNKDGKPVTAEKEKRKLISEMVDKFTKITLPMLKSFQMI